MRQTTGRQAHENLHLKANTYLGGLNFFSKLSGVCGLKDLIHPKSLGKHLDNCSNNQLSHFVFLALSALLVFSLVISSETVMHLGCEVRTAATDPWALTILHCHIILSFRERNSQESKMKTCQCYAKSCHRREEGKGGSGKDG